MKYLIFSDLHGDYNEALWLIEYYQKSHCDGMICLGDVLYHGPRNDLPSGYQPKKVIELLNLYAEQILCIQGNCDAEVDQMVLKFKLHSFLDIILNGHNCHLEHGHHLNEHKSESEFIFYGHTHICTIEKNESHVYLNPGSISIPKNNTPKSFMVLDEKGIYLLDKEEHMIEKYLFD